MKPKTKYKRENNEVQNQGYRIIFFHMQFYAQFKFIYILLYNAHSHEQTSLTSKLPDTN